MAKAPEKPEKQEAAENQAPPKKRSKVLLFVAVGIFLLVFAGGGAAYFLIKKKSAEADAEDDGTPRKEAKADSDHVKPPTYLKLDAFTTNLLPEAPEQQPQYIQLMVELRVEDAAAGDAVKGYMPELRDRILRLLSSKKPSELMTLEGKDALAAAIRGTANRIVNPPRKGRDGKPVEPDGPVQSVAFTSFIIQ